MTSASSSDNTRAPAAPARVLRSHLELAKPRITLLVALTAAAGFALGSPGPLDWAGLWWTALGVALASASTGCLNQALEAEHDALMARTRNRPLPSGRASPGAAWALGTLWGAAGLGLLLWRVNPSSFALTAFTLGSYLWIYTPMKRRSPWSLAVGAVPGALPPVIGWAAAGAALDGRALALFLVQFAWQLPHFLALAWLYREDYRRAGFKICGSEEGRIAWELSLSSAALAVAGLFPFVAGLAGPAYLAGALFLGGSFAWIGLRPAGSSDLSARRVFLASLAYLPAFYLVLLAAPR